MSTPAQPIEIEASTIKEAVAVATEKLEAGETNVTVVAEEEIEGDEKSWRKRTAQSLKQLADSIAKNQNETTEVRAMLTRIEDRFKLVISSKEHQPPENSAISPTSETLPLNPPVAEQTAGPASGAGDHPEAVDEPPMSPQRKRRKI